MNEINAELEVDVDFLHQRKIIRKTVNTLHKLLEKHNSLNSDAKRYRAMALKDAFVKNPVSAQFDITIFALLAKKYDDFAVMKSPALTSLEMADDVDILSNLFVSYLDIAASYISLQDYSNHI